MITLQDNLKYSIESVHTVLNSVPQGSQFHKCTSRILNYLTAAKQLCASAATTTGTASVTLLEPTAPVPPMHLGIPAKKGKEKEQLVTLFLLNKRLMLIPQHQCKWSLM